jgi:hypothetical protein
MRFLHFAGFRYWTASLLPALVGTTLPFWLRPPGFSFSWLVAIEFLIATALFHAGFSFLQARFEGRSTPGWPGSRLLRVAGACIVAGCLLGLHLNSRLTLQKSVPGSIFILYGLCTLFVGVLYVAPPLNFCRRADGEVVACEPLPPSMRAKMKSTISKVRRSGRVRPATAFSHERTRDLLVAYATPQSERGYAFLVMRKRGDWED